MRERLPKDDMARQLSSPDKGFSKATGTLSRFYRLILIELDVKYSEWDAQMLKYLSDPRNGIRQDSKSRSSARGNLNKEIQKSVMSWKVFQKGLKLLAPLRIHFEVRLDWANKTSTVHKFKIETAELLDQNEDEGDDDLIGEDCGISVTQADKLCSNVIVGNFGHSKDELSKMRMHG